MNVYTLFGFPLGLKKNKNILLICIHGKEEREHSLGKSRLPFPVVTEVEKMSDACREPGHERVTWVGSDAHEYRLDAVWEEVRWVGEERVGTERQQ